MKDLKTIEREKSLELSELKSTLESTKLQLTNKQNVMEQQIGALRFQLSSQQMEADLAMQVRVFACYVIFLGGLLFLSSDDRSEQPRTRFQILQDLLIIDFCR